MNHPLTTYPPPSSQNAQQQVDALEALLQVLSINVPSEIVLQAVATAEEGTIDALITRFEDITSILQQAKRQQKLKRKDYENDLMLEQQSLERDSKTLGNRARMPTEVLRQLTQSGFLSTADLAKTLLLTCKCYGIDLGREYVYQHLCKSRWRSTTKLPPSLIANRGYYWLFRNLCRGPYLPEEPSPIPPRPGFDYDSMILSVSIRQESGKEIVSEVLSGEQLQNLKRDGNLAIVLEPPISIGTYPLASVHAYARSTTARDEECRNWSVTVHLFRLDENKCCCVHKSDNCNWIMNYGPPLVGFVNSTTGIGVGYVNSTTEDRNPVGGILDFDRYGPERNHFRYIQFDVQLDCVIGEQAPHPDVPAAGTVALKYGEVRLTARRVDLTSDTEVGTPTSEEYGVSLPQLLEHLKGWDAYE